MVLIADDDTLVRSLVARILKAYGFAPLEAENGLEAVELYVSHSSEITLVITDVQMPVMGGPEAVRRMKEMSPEVRVIVMTGAATDLRVGENHLLRKPFTPAQLMETVGEVLRAA